MPTSQEKRSWALSARLPVKTVAGTSYEITARDANTCVEFTNVGAVSVTVAEVLRCKGISVLLKRAATAGTVTVAAGSGLTLESDNGAFTLATNSKLATVFYVEDDRAVIAGAE